MDADLMVAAPVPWGHGRVIWVAVIAAVYVIVVVISNLVGLYHDHQFLHAVAQSHGVCYLNTGTPIPGDRVSCWVGFHPWHWAWI